MRMEDRTLISVIMGVYYRRADTALLERSIGSILTQSYDKLELLICDDGSSAEAKGVIDRFAEGDRRIRRIRPGGKIALAEKLNACLKEAKGTLVARMDDDDRAHPDRLERQVTWLSSHPEISFLGSSAALWREGNCVGIRSFPEYPTERDFLFRQPYLHPAILFRRDALWAAGGYSEDKSCILCEDYDLLLRLCETGFRGANLPECLLDYTLPAAGKSSRRMGHRWNEAVTRYRHFKRLRLLPEAYPYVIKPLAVGLIPEGMLERLKKWAEKEGRL